MGEREREEKLKESKSWIKERLTDFLVFGICISCVFQTKNREKNERRI